MGDLMSTVKANDLMKVDGGIPTVKGQKLIPTAWACFNGTGTVAVRDSENVSSIGDNGVGLFTINFTTAMANSEYVVAGSVIGSVNGNMSAMYSVSGGQVKTVNAFNSRWADPNGTLYDSDKISVIVLGGQS